jgi:hypothetical protein
MDISNDSVGVWFDLLLLVFDAFGVYGVDGCIVEVEVWLQSGWDAVGGVGSWRDFCPKWFGFDVEPFRVKGSTGEIT